MALTGIYGEVTTERAQATLHRALDLGIRLFDTAALYSGGGNEVMLGEVLGDRPEVFIVTKFGLIEGRDGKLVRDSQPETIRRSVDASLMRLRRDQIGLLLQHRPDPGTPDEVVADVAADLIREGKIGAFGLSASSVGRIETFRPSVAVSAIQNELSLVASKDISLPADADRAGAMYMAYAPLGRGILTGRSVDRDFAQHDLRAGMAQFDADRREADIRSLDTIDAVARRHGTTRAAIALAWVLHTAENVVAIPGARSPDHVTEVIETVNLRLTSQDVGELNGIARA
jgi:aryl-alcohol dehydrogenase-like predicted oxidoreductase